MFPVEEKIDDVRRALAANRCVVLTAPPGSGKTTCVPPALLDEPWLEGRRILMLEPRRLAARSCASRIARTMGEEVGGTVGYQVRLERKVSSRTRLEIVTEGLLTQRLLSDPELGGVGLVIFDEFHERSLACDTGFAFAIESRRAFREDLRIMVMSATLDAGEVRRHLGDAVDVRAEGRMFPVETRYLGDVPLSAAVARAMKETEGDILCFLPGEGEIRRAEEALAALSAASAAEVLPLYGSLPREMQDRVFAPSARRRIILSTSLAETSLTIPGISCVVDSGLMRVPRFSPATGMSALVTLPLSLDRAEQRRGRAGRVGPGVCYRLWDEGGNGARAARMTPEILDADLASLVMSSAAWGAVRRTDLPWLTPPPAASWEQASGLLRMLGALEADGRISAKGARMASMPMHPRLASMVLGGGDPLLAAVIEEGAKSRETDLRRIADEVRETPSRPFSRRVRELARRFAANAASGAKGAGRAGASSEGAALALAYPDRIARNRGNGTFRMVSGRGASLDPDDPLSRSEFLVCCELDGRQGDAKVFLACPVSREEIEELFADGIRERRICEWNRREERVDSSVRRMLGEMVLSERTVPANRAGGDGDVAAALVEGVRQKGVGSMPCWTKEAEHLRARINFLARVMPRGAGCAHPWPAAGDGEILGALPGYVGGMTRFTDLESLDMAGMLESLLLASGHTRRELDALAPARMELPTGSRMLIRYDGDEPSVEARLQECFGMMETPRIAGGRIPVVMTLLSPAHRPVQITKDLAGFWRGAYSLVRKDMRGRYPKHYWPEDPLTAVATRRTRPAS